MNNQQTNDTVQSLSGFERIIRVVSITLIIVFALEILFFVAGYIGMVHMKIETALWFLWSFFYALFILVTPIIFIITISGAGYLFFRVLKQRGNRHVAITAAIAAGMNLLALLSMHAIGRASYWHVKNTYGDIVTEQKDWKGEALPNFTFQGIQEGVPPIGIKDLQGKRSVLVFWAMYDTPWSSNFKVAQELYEQKEKLNINLFAIAVDSSKEDVKKFLERHPSNMPVYHNPNAKYEHSLPVIGSVEQVFIVDSMARIQIVLETSPDVFDKIKVTLDRIQ
jgi:peroxiredoxin